MLSMSRRRLARVPLQHYGTYSKTVRQNATRTRYGNKFSNANNNSNEANCVWLCANVIL